LDRVVDHRLADWQVLRVETLLVLKSIPARLLSAGMSTPFTFRVPFVAAFSNGILALRADAHLQHPDSTDVCEVC
jgi:hypothetical protein